VLLAILYHFVIAAVIEMSLTHRIIVLHTFVALDLETSTVYKWFDGSCLV